MKEFTNFCFNGGDTELIGITRYGVIWTSSQENSQSFYSLVYF